jgi:hypothetical protein
MQNGSKLSLIVDFAIPFGELSSRAVQILQLLRHIIKVHET